MNPESLKQFDRRGARAVGSQPPPARFSLLLELPKKQQQKTKNKTTYTKFFTKPKPLGSFSKLMVL